MGIISVNDITDGTTADAADVNANINTIADEINGNLDANNLTTGAIGTAQISDGSITEAKYSTDDGELGGDWETWTPTIANLSEGNGTMQAYYQQIGKTVRVYLHFVFGSTSSLSGAIVTELPTTPHTRYTTGFHAVGTALFLDSGTATYGGQALFKNTGAYVDLRPNSTTNTGRVQGTSASLPHTWAVDDEFSSTFEYEAA